MPPPTVRQPVSDQWETIKSLLADGLAPEDGVAMRRKIALTLPAMIKAIRISTPYEAAPAIIGTNQSRSGRWRRAKPARRLRAVWTLDWLDTIKVTLPATIAGDLVRIEHAKATGQAESWEGGEVIGPI